MTRLSETAQGIGRLSVVFSAVLVIGCGSAKIQEAPDPKNPLPAGVDSNPAAFRQKLADIKPGAGHTRGRDAKCFLGLCKDVQVTIHAVGNTLLIDPDNPPASGVPVARLVNLHTEKKELYYGLKPQSEAEYYLWVDANPKKKTQWTLLEVPFKGDRVLAAKPKDLKLCHRWTAEEQKSAKSEADFAENKHDGNCDYKVAAATLGVHTASTLSVRPVIALIHHVTAIAYLGWGMQGGWIGCSNGCCT